MGSEAKNEIVLFNSKDGSLSLPVSIEADTVWLSRMQMATLFGVTPQNITIHLRKVYESNELTREATSKDFLLVQKEGTRSISRVVTCYNLDAIISIGYRVNSSRATQFRIWATSVLKSYLLRGVAVNQMRLQQLNQTVEVMKRVSHTLDAEQVLDVVKTYSTALDLLDGYDHQSIAKPKAERVAVELSYEECREFIDGMRFAAESTLFGNEKDGSFKSALGAVYQSFGGEDLYPSAEEKAANLLYLVTKNHAFSDGNKRIAAALFLYFLKRNNLLLRENGLKRIADHTLVALTVMIASSQPQEKDLMVNLVMTFLQ
ncbi:MAG: virulence protein RhuM/Fic/DOC family protein [Kiritimatiellae bacterium]|nr:virulence protein RhuM/Fic/DOC family protein [Kiritimatiellia bacterium]